MARYLCILASLMAARAYTSECSGEECLAQVIEEADVALSLLQKEARKLAASKVAVDSTTSKDKNKNKTVPAGYNVNVMYASDAYIMVSAALIFAMSIPGLPLLYGGLVQSKHVISTMTQCMAVGPIVGFIWTVVGYSLSFSGTGPYLGNLDQFMLLALLRDRNRIYEHPYGPLPESVYFVFQAAFAIITAMLIVGAWAERAKFFPSTIFCGLWSLLVYCPLAHWIWGGGWLAQMGCRDFAGGLVVHLSAGSAAWVAALLIPARQGFPEKVAPPHSFPMVITGLGIIWLGWFGFNGASALQAGGEAGMTVVSTQTAAITALLVWLALESMRSKPTIESVTCGAIAGLGGITPASGYVGVPGAIILGIACALATYLAWYICKERGHLDDALDVFPIHGISGSVGTLLVAFLSTETLGGVGYAPGVGMGRLFLVQFIGVAATFVWSSLVSFILIKVLDMTVGFCHSKEVQAEGIDAEDHNADAYAFSSKSLI